MEQDDFYYFLTRAEAELELAQSAAHPNVVRAHYLLAESYLERVYGADCSESTNPEPA